MPEHAGESRTVLSPIETTARWVAVSTVFALAGTIAFGGRAETPAAGHAPKLSYDRARDPQIGKPVQLPAKDILGRAVSMPDGLKPTLLIFAGSCDSCTAKSLSADAFDMAHYAGVVFVFEAGDEKPLIEFAEKSAGYVRVLMDNGTAMRKALNALLIPRFYLIDARAKLLDIQSDPNVKPPFVHWREGRR